MTRTSDGTPYGSEDALRDVDLARQEIVTRGVTPAWYHPVVGLGLGLVLLAFGLDRGLVAVLAGFAVVLAATLGTYTHRSGMRFGLGQTTRRGRALLGALAVALLFCFFLVIGGRDAGHVWLVLAGAVLTPVFYVVLGRAYDRQLFADVRAGRVAAPLRGRSAR